jgi:hypothetical protein
MNYLSLRNAHLRARWLLLYLTQARCADPWPEVKRAWYDVRLIRQRQRARDWLAANRTARTPVNVVLLRRVAK